MERGAGTCCPGGSTRCRGAGWRRPLPPATMPAAALDGRREHGRASNPLLSLRVFVSYVALS